MEASPYGHCTLFCKRTPLTDDRLPWLRGSEELPWTAWRNASGKGVVSAILVRALISALETNRSRSASHVRAAVRSHSKPDTAAGCWLDWTNSRYGVPDGDETKGAYHLGVLSIVQTLGEPELAQDFWQAYTG